MLIHTMVREEILKLISLGTRCLDWILNPTTVFSNGGATEPERPEE